MSASLQFDASFGLMRFQNHGGFFVVTTVAFEQII